MSDKIFAVAVDGPSGAGKSTLAKAVAAELGIVYVDTGAIYRSIGCYMHDHQIDPHDAQAVAAALPQVRIQIRYGADGLQRMILNDEDVTDRIRLPEMSKFASAVSAIPAVRAFLLDMQRDMAKQHSVIMDGRDIGTVVLPDADVKIYLTAGADVRAQRRMKELAERGTPRPYDEVLHEIEERDWADTHREIAPLRRAEDAVLVDTSAMDFDESRRAILDVIRSERWLKREYRGISSTESSISSILRPLFSLCSTRCAPRGGSTCRRRGRRSSAPTTAALSDPYPARSSRFRAALSHLRVMAKQPAAAGPRARLAILRRDRASFAVDRGHCGHARVP